jgi:hypothetical protein
MRRLPDAGQPPEYRNFAAPVEAAVVRSQAMDGRSGVPWLSNPARASKSGEAAIKNDRMNQLALPNPEPAKSMRGG